MAVMGGDVCPLPPRSCIVLTCCIIEAGAVCKRGELGADLDDRGDPIVFGLRQAGLRRSSLFFGALKFKDGKPEALGIS